MYPSVTKILSKTKDKKGLESWRASVGEAEADRIIQEAFKRGRLLDENVQLYADQNQSNNALLDDFLEPYTIQSTEQQVVSQKYCYEGRYDAILVRNGITYINDFKTASKPKKLEYIEDYKLQIGAYYGALLEQGIMIDRGIIAIFTDKSYQEFIFLGAEMRQFYKRFLNRLKEYYVLVNIENGKQN